MKLQKTNREQYYLTLPKHVVEAKKVGGVHDNFWGKLRDNLHLTQTPLNNLNLIISQC